MMMNDSILDVADFCQANNVSLLIKGGKLVDVCFEDALTEEEIDVIEFAKIEMSKCKDKDSINKVYRQLRIWNRWHSLPAQPNKGRSKYVYTYLNETFKGLRWAFLTHLEEK